MENLLSIITENKEWLFSGLAVAIFGYFFKKKGESVNKKQKAGNDSRNYMAGGDIKIGKDDDKE